MKYEKWYRALWLLIPIAGIPAFLLTVKESYQKQIKLNNHEKS